MKTIRRLCILYFAFILLAGRSFAQPPVYGGGTPNYLAKFTLNNPVIIGQSIIYDNGTSVGIGTTSLSLGKLVVRSANTDNIAWFSGNNSAMVVVNNFNESEFVGRDVANSTYKAISFRANSSTGQLYLSTSGNVGIGTTAPQRKLSVNGIIHSMSGGFQFPDGTVQTTAASGGGSSSQWTLSGSNIYSNNGGNVGIGMTNPSYGKLVVKSSSSDNIAWLSGNSSAMVVVNNLNESEFVGRDPANSIYKAIGFRAGSTTGQLYLSTNGCVGIGTLSPGQKLSVAGTIESTTGGFKFPDGTVQTTASGGASQWMASGGNIYSSNSGNVGIGATQPLQKMDVHGRVLISYEGFGGSSRAKPSEAGSVIELAPGDYQGARNSLIYTGRDQNVEKLTFDPGSGALMTLDGGGRVGIGTSSPSQKLSVVGTIESTTGGFKFPDGTVQTTAGGGGGWTTNGSDIYSNNTGNVGIGRLPSQKLDVNGAIAVSGTSVIDNGRNISAAGGTFTGNMTISGSGGLTLSSGPLYLPNNAAILMKSASGTSGAVLFADASNNINFGDYSGPLNGNLIFRTAQTERMRILSGGNVLVGKTSQQNAAYKLDVAGSVRASEVVVNTDGADFVFEEGYKLMDLPALAIFVKENKHLPDIATSEELQKGGLGVGQTQTKLLQKIEELTLYVIDQEKRIQEQASRIEELEKENAEMTSAE